MADNLTTVTESETHGPDPAAEFFSAFGINDDVEFRPMFRHQKRRGIEDEKRDGRIVAVRFTESKVFYDVLCTYDGRVFKNVDSGKVYAPSFTPLPQPEATEPVERG